MYEQINANLPTPNMDNDDSDREASDEELLYPWERREPEHEWFQAAMWEHVERHVYLVAEQEIGPYYSETLWQITLLEPAEGDEANTLIREIETGLPDASTAIHEAKAMMMLNEVLDDE